MSDPIYNEEAMNIVKQAPGAHYLVKNLIRRPHTDQLWETHIDISD